MKINKNELSNFDALSIDPADTSSWVPERPLQDPTVPNLQNEVHTLTTVVGMSGSLTVTSGIPKQVLSVNATESPYRQQDGTVYSQVSVSFIRDASDTNFAGANIWFSGYRGNPNPTLVASGIDSPITFLCEVTQETVTVTVQPFSGGGQTASLEKAVGVMLALDGVVSAPPAPTVVDSLISTPTGLQFSFEQIDLGNTQDAVSAYRIYRSSDNDPTHAVLIRTYKHDPTALGNIVVQDAVTAGTSFDYWVSAVNTAGLESALTAAETGTVLADGWHASTGLNPQGSVNPQALTCSGTLTGTLDISNNPIIRFAFTAGYIYMPDGTNIYVNPTTPQDFSTWNGIAVASSTVYGGNLCFDVATQAVVIQQYSAAPTVQQKADAWADGKIAINVGITITTPTPYIGGGGGGGTGGGGGGGGFCFSGNTHVNVPTGTMAFDEIELAGGEVVIRNEFGEFVAHLLVHASDTREMIDMGRGELVTPDHLMWSRSQARAIPAAEMFKDRPRVYFTGKVYNLSVEGRMPSHHWYVLANGNIASNMKIALNPE